MSNCLIDKSCCKNINEKFYAYDFVNGYNANKQNNAH
ncbi:MAG: hypothetical protein K0R06_560 [Clostridium sp.]|nr:hypothetical protein [Clostridium sp.]